MDTFSEKKRSEIMRKVKSQNTSPEVRLRSLLHARAYRYRLHRKDLPGSPDIVFPGKKVAIFVNGRFWHGHSCKRGKNMPKANAQYWKNKIEKNIKRDIENYKKLRSLGWRCLIVWECSIKKSNTLQTIKCVENFLSSAKKFHGI